MPKGGLSCRTRSMSRSASVGDFGGTFFEIQWVVHTPEWEPETLVGILGLDRMWVREE
jgi:hypothetical protein